MKIVPKIVNTAKSAELKTRNNNIKTNNVSYTTAPDSFSKSEFNLEKALNTLKEIKTKNAFGRDTSKFNIAQMNVLSYTLAQEPKKWNSVYALAQKDYIDGGTVAMFSKEPLEKLDTLREYSDVKNSKSKPKYTEANLREVARNTNTEEIQKLQPLTKTSLDVKNIIGMRELPEKFIGKITNKVIDFEKNVCKNNVEEIVFVENNSDRAAYNITAKTGDNTLKSVLLDKDLKTDAAETVSVYRTGNDIYEIKKVNDYRNNTISKVRFKLDKENGNYPVVTHEVRVVKDKNDNVVKTEYTAPSEVPGIFDIKVQYPDGKTDIVSSGTVNKKTGITTVKKNMTSLDGTKTEYLYEDDVNGNRLSDYKITDKNGNVLLQKSSTFEVVSPNKFISSNNNDKYEIVVNEKTIDVKDMNNPKRFAKIDIDRSLLGNKRKLLQSLKQMPGEELIKLSQSTNKLVGIGTPLESYYQPDDKSIHSSDQLFVVLHELGHARDYRDLNVDSEEEYYNTINKTISSDVKLLRIYEDEVEKFNKAFPDAQRDHIDYFINTLNHYGGELGGLMETVAESNAILTTPKTMDLLAIRSQYLQQYFPKTIAYLSNVLNTEKVA